MRFALILGLAAAASSAHAAERSYLVTGFTEVAVAGPHQVIVETGKPLGVRAVGDSKAIEQLDVRVSGKKLTIGTKSQSGWRWSGGDDTLTITVTVPGLAGVAFSGSGDMRVDRLKSDSVAVRLGGSGSLSVGAIDARAATIELSGSGDLTVAGRCETGSLALSGSGTLAASALACRTLAAKLAGSGDLSAAAERSATVTVTGSGDVVISGSPECAVNATGSGTVRCGKAS